MGIHGLNNNPRAIPPRTSGRGIPRDLMKHLNSEESERFAYINGDVQLVSLFNQLAEREAQCEALMDACTSLLIH